MYHVNPNKDTYGMLFAFEGLKSFSLHILISIHCVYYPQLHLGGDDYAQSHTIEVLNLC